MRVWRIAKARHAGTVQEMLSGRGAAINAGRWNSEGRPVLYTSQSASLAALEILVNLKTPSVLRSAYVRIDIEVPDALIERADPLVKDRSASRAFGDEWFDSRRSVALSVPSRVINPERNVLLNTAHPEFGRCRPGVITPFEIDQRLLDLIDPRSAR
jgi:RES domain-containing protein